MIGAIVVAAGAGRRFGGAVPKAFLPFQGRPLFAHSLPAFRALRSLGDLVLVVPRGRVQWVIRRVGAALLQGGVTKVVAGGRRRQDSVRRGLEAMNRRCDVVLVHDAARPFVTASLARAVAALARREGGAVPLLAVRETLKRVVGDLVVETLDRSGVAVAQTPQGARTALLRQAYAEGHGDADATDDVQLLERLGARVAGVVGDPLNVKITSRADLPLAEYIVTLR